VYPTALKSPSRPLRKRSDQPLDLREP
jgi:hypothetical protein